MSWLAKHPGICGCGCGEYFDRGDSINRTLEGEYVIEGHEQAARASRNKVCPKCHLEHAGECF